MVQTLCKHTALVFAIIVATIIQLAAAQSPPPRIGFVIMHGKGGSPTKHVADLASSLKDKGYLVANLEMPWSGRRDYDANVAGAEKEVESALDSASRGRRICSSLVTARGGCSHSILVANTRSTVLSR